MKYFNNRIQQILNARKGNNQAYPCQSYLKCEVMASISGISALEAQGILNLSSGTSLRADRGNVRRMLYSHSHVHQEVCAHMHAYEQAGQMRANVYSWMKIGYEQPEIKSDMEDEKEKSSETQHQRFSEANKRTPNRRYPAFPTPQ